MNHVLFLSMVSKIPHFGALELKLELVRNQGDELRIEEMGKYTEIALR